MSTVTAKILTSIFSSGTNTLTTTSTAASSENTNNTANIYTNNNNGSLVLKAPPENDIKFFDENDTPFILYGNEQSHETKNRSQIVNTKTPSYKVKKKVTFPEDDKIIKDYSEPPKQGWTPGSFSTVDLLESYLKSCDRHKCKPLNKLIPHLKALQDIDCANGEKVNVLNLKSERLDSKQMEALEEIFKRLSFKTIDLESSYFDDDSAGATLFEILQFYDTCERLILANNRSISLFGWQELSKFIRKSSSIEHLDLRGHTFPELIYFTYIARSFKLTQTLRVIHLEFSNIQGRYLLMLAAALKDNELIKEVYLSDNKLQATDGNSIATLIKENSHLELIDLKNNNLQDLGLSHICSGLSEKTDPQVGIKTLIISNNNITANGVSYLSKALIHNRSLKTLNIGQNSLANEAIYELKEALIVNKQISGLHLNKTKLTDEGTIALAEYIAETQSLNRLDLRENDIRLGGLMALASSLKFNKTLFRLDLDRDPKRENSIKDSVETSKRFIQDINEYCLRNKRLEADREIALKEQLLKEEEERKKQIQENEKQLFEQATESNYLNNSEINQSKEKVEKEQVNTNVSIENLVDVKEKEEIVDLIVDSDDDDNEKLLKKILSRNLNSTPSLLSPLNNIDISSDLINFLNNGKKTTDNKVYDSNVIKSNSISQEADFQLIESELNSETNVDDIVLDEKIEKERKVEVIFDKKQDDLLNDTNLCVENEKAESKSLDDSINEIFATAKELVDNVIKNTQQKLVFETIQSNEDSSILMNNSTLTNFNDSNDLSQSIEKLKLCEDPEESASTFSSESKFDYLSNGIIDTSTNNTSINDEEDSDIEVLTVSSNFTNKVLQDVAVIKLNENLPATFNLLKPNDKSKSAAFLDSITEHEVDCLFKSNGLKSNEVDSIKEELVSSQIQKESAIISNYDLITDHPQLWINGKNSFQFVDSIVKKCTDYSLNGSYKQTMTENETATPPSTPILKINSSSNLDDLMLTSTPYSNSDIVNRLQTTSLFVSNQSENLYELNSNSSITNFNDKIETVNDLMSEHANENIVNDTNTKPFFASELTNSQMSEELSHEIGLLCE